VTGPDGHVVRGRAAAAGLATMTLEFHDGALSVVPADGVPPALATTRPPARASSRPGPGPTSGQGDLF
jgi:hypothetical protein